MTVTSASAEGKNHEHPSRNDKLRVVRDASGTAGTTPPSGARIQVGRTNEHVGANHYGITLLRMLCVASPVPKCAQDWHSAVAVCRPSTGKGPKHDRLRLRLAAKTRSSKAAFCHGFSLIKMLQKRNRLEGLRGGFRAGNLARGTPTAVLCLPVCP